MTNITTTTTHTKVIATTTHPGCVDAGGPRSRQLSCGGSATTALVVLGSGAVGFETERPRRGERREES